MLHSVTFNYKMDISWKRFLWIMSFKRGEAKRNLSSFSDYSDQIVKGKCKTASFLPPHLYIAPYRGRYYHQTYPYFFLLFSSFSSFSSFFLIFFIPLYYSLIFSDNIFFRLNISYVLQYF